MCNAAQGQPSAAYRPRLERLIDGLGEGLLERGEAIRLSLLAALTGESIFFLGPPGVAKSLIARRLKHVFSPSARSFEYLMHRFSTPDEIFGPVSISRLRDYDELSRKTELYLPGATVVFLDEIWKAGPSIQNTLLTVLNERIFRNAGRDEVVELRALVAASNELPAVGEGLAALWDRFLMRLMIESVGQAHSRHQLLRGPLPPQPAIAMADQFTKDDLGAIDQQIDSIDIGDDILWMTDELVSLIADYNREHGHTATPGASGEPEELQAEPGALFVSDRRWRQIGRLLKASALFNGRREVDLIDCFLVRCCIWSEPRHLQDDDGVDSMILAALQRTIERRRLDRFESRWKALKADAANLGEMTLQPRAFDGFFKLDVSGRGEHLSDGTNVYLRISQGVLESLTTRFATIELHSAAGAAAKVQARKGPAGSVVLKKDSGALPLEPFRETTYPLQREATPRRKRAAKDAPEAARSLAAVAALRSDLRDEIGRITTERSGFRAGCESHLFVSPPRESCEAITASLQKLAASLMRTAEAIDSFLAGGR